MEGGFDCFRWVTTYVHVDVDVADATPTDDISEPVDAQELAVFVARVVDEGEEFVHVGPSTRLDAFLAREFGREIEWGGLDAAEVVLLVVIVPCEFLGRVRRRAQHQRQDKMDLTEHLLFDA